MKMSIAGGGGDLQRSRTPRRIGAIVSQWNAADCTTLELATTSKTKAIVEAMRRALRIEHASG